MWRGSESSRISDDACEFIMKREVVCGVALLALQCQVAFGFRGSPVRRLAPSRLQVGPEHLIDCAQSPQLAELFGGAKSDVCLQTQMGLFSGVGLVFDQAITIGFLVMSYFFFKRSTNGVVDWIDTEVDDDDILDSSPWAGGGTSSRGVNRVVSRRSSTSGDIVEEITCPQCAGTGKFSWGDDVDDEDDCELCGGTGIVEKLQRGTGAVTSYELPRSGDDRRL